MELEVKMIGLGASLGARKPQARETQAALCSQHKSNEDDGFTLVIVTFVTNISPLYG